jgi:hypothetical protein
MSIKVIPESTKPLPDDYTPEEISAYKDKIRIAAATAKRLLESGAKIPVSTQEKVEAEELFKAYTNPAQEQPDASLTRKYLNTPATVQHLYLMLSDYDHKVVDEAVQLRRYITNKLLEDTNLPDPRHRLRALELLGKISDVGLFAEKTEITIKNVTADKLEEQIRSKLVKLLDASGETKDEANIIDAEIVLNDEPDESQT